MQAGKLRHRVTITRPRAEELRDEYGQRDETPETVATRWASVEPLQGRELILAQQVQAETTHRVRLRGPRPAGLDERSKVAWSGGTLAVESVIDKDGRGIELELLCKETR